MSCGLCERLRRWSADDQAHLAARAPGGGQRAVAVERNWRTAFRMNVTLTEATIADAPALAGLHTEVAERLTRDFGRGHWSTRHVGKGRLVCDAQCESTGGAATHEGHRNAPARDEEALGDRQGVLQRLPAPLYLTGMAVATAFQRRGIGRAMLEDAQRVARDWPADCIRLDAYDFPGGAGEFYAKCGFREVGRVVYRKTPLIYYELLL